MLILLLFWKMVQYDQIGKTRGNGGSYHQSNETISSLDLDVAIDTSRKHVSLRVMTTSREGDYMLNVPCALLPRGAIFLN